MSDLFNLGNLAQADVNSPGSPTGYTGGSPVDTGDMRRKYNFGDRVSELAIAQDPFFRFVSKVAKKPTDDPSFKFTEKRGSFHKRYAYVVAGGDVKDEAITDAKTNAQTAGLKMYLKMGTDYKNKGNLVNRYGQTVDYYLGQAGTDPIFFVPGQLVKIPTTSANNATNNQTVKDYIVGKITKVYTDGNYTQIEITVIKTVAAANAFLMGVHLSTDGAADKTASEEELAPYKCYVVGSAHGEGEGYPETWKDQPYSTSYGTTQIWKTSMAMTNTARATVLKYEPNEWARVWKEKLIEHKWDMEQSLLFGTQNSDHNTTQGAVDYISNYGNYFTLDTTSKTSDGFLDDMSAYLDPRYNGSSATVFFVNTGVYNWMHKLGGYFKNNLEISPNFNSDMALSGKKKVLGVDISTFSTPYGDMNVARNIHLDGTDIQMLGINMKNCAYRPLVGNGVNRDTSVYVGVQTLENSGIDRRVDLILTEAGMEWSHPESHAVWKSA